MSTRDKIRRLSAVAVAGLFLLQLTVASAGAYDLGTTVADLRQSAFQSGGTSCPQLTRLDVSSFESTYRVWSTSLPANPTTILTANQDPDGQLNEIEAMIEESLSTWTGVSGTSLAPPEPGTLLRDSSAEVCVPDGLNSICFNQNDPGFALGVLAFTRVVTADTVGQQVASDGAPSTFIGEILGADVLVLPGNTNVRFATPEALAANPNAYDLESIVTHELGHTFGFNHSGVWGSMMFPFAPAPGQIAGTRPTQQAPDGPLSDDDRTGLRVLYPDPGDATHIGSITGHVLPANPVALPISPAGVTGIFPAQVVAVDDATGAVAAAVLGGWSCGTQGPTQFDGTFSLQRLKVGPLQRYRIYAEPLDGPVVLGSVISNLTSLCRNPTTDPGWPAQGACTVPEPAAPFSARFRSSP
jgi:hypothetical protein